MFKAVMKKQHLNGKCTTIVLQQINRCLPTKNHSTWSHRVLQILKLSFGSKQTSIQNCCKDYDICDEIYQTSKNKIARETSKHSDVNSITLTDEEMVAAKEYFFKKGTRSIIVYSDELWHILNPVLLLHI